jgi:hypothetical protein
MRKFMILGALVALVVAALALPALAQDRSPFGDDQNQPRFEQRFDRLQDRAEERDYTNEEASEFYVDRLADFYGFDNDWWNDEQDYWWDDRNINNDEVVPAVNQSFDQQAESGDVSQSFNVSNTGDNSNQCANVQGVANTGNAQNQIGVLQYGSEADDFSFEDSGSTITVSPNSATRCDQAVNQAATAYGR